MGLEPTLMRTQTLGSASAPQASAEAFGMGIARGLNDVLQSKDRYDAEQKRKDQNAQLAAANVEFAADRAEMERMRTDARANAGPGAAGHYETLKAAWEARQKERLAAIKDPDVRQRMETAYASWGGDFTSGEYAFERHAHDAKTVDDTDGMIDLQANRARTAADPKALGEELDLFETYVGALQVSDEIKQKLLKEQRGRVTRSYVEGLTARDPKAAESLLGSGALDTYLEPKQLDVLRSEAGVEIRRVEARQQAAVALAKSEAREKINTFQKMLSDGVPVPDGELAAAIDLADKAGMSGEVYDLAKSRILNNANRVWQAATPAQLAGEVVKLDAKIAKAGDKPNANDVILRDHLVTMRDRRRTEVEKDPLGFGARNGLSVAPIDWGDAKSIAGRVQQANAVAAATGTTPQYLLPDEAEQLRDEIAGGRSGKLAALARLSALGGRQAVLAARQVAPSDDAFARLVGLPVLYQNFALNGQEAMKANAAILKPANDADKEIYARQETAVRAAMKAVNAGDIEGTLSVARNIMAGLLASNGGTVDPQTNWKAINMAMGAVRVNGQWRGGLGQWNGQVFRLPDNVSMTGFEAAIARRAKLDPARAPVNPDGSAIDLKRAYPVIVGPGVYRWETAGGGLVRARDGSLFTTTVTAR